MTNFIRRRKQASGDTEDRDKRRAALLKLGALLIFSVIVIVIGSIAWFTMNDNNNANGMGVKAKGLPYIIETRSGSGYYSNIYNSLNSDAAEWKISSAHNFDNHSSAIEENEEEPALEPGDHGSLEFRINPINSDSLTVDCLFDIKAYSATETEDEHGVTTTTLTEINDSSLVGYISAHIMLFTNYDPQTGKYSGLIDNDNVSLERLLEDQVYRKGESTYTTIYWYWPEHLSDLTDRDNTIYAPSEHENVIDYIARNRNGFFKDCNDSESKVRTDLTNLYTTYSNQIYNHYNLRFDNADLDIGNNISYIVLSMQIK